MIVEHKLNIDLQQNCPIVEEATALFDLRPIVEDRLINQK